MPVIERFGSFVIRMYFEDHNPPHVHVESRQARAQVSIDDRTVLAGDLPSKYADEALAWIAENREHLLRKWAEYSS